MHIFIAARYGDNVNICDRMADHLRQRYGAQHILRDLAQADTAIRRSRVVLAVIGPQWLNDVNLAGDRLLDNPADPVHAALALALREGKFVVPLLIDGAAMPAASMLPADLAPLATKQAFVVRGDPFFLEDMLQALAQINTQLAWRPASWGTLGGTQAFIASFLAIVLTFAVSDEPVPTTGTLNGLLILSIFSTLAIFLVTVAWAVRVVVKRQGWGWLAALITAIVLLFGVPITTALAGLPRSAANVSLLLGGGIIMVALFGVGLFGPRRETTRAFL